MPKTFNVIAVGRAYTDIITHASAEFLQTHQIPLDGQRECSIAQLQEIQQSLSQPQMVAGGSSANTVAIVAALGGKAGFFGKVFRDAAGQHFLDDCKKRNVDLCCPSSYASTPKMSATCLVLLTGDKRSFAYNPGCGDYFSATDFDKFDFSTADFFLLEAHLLTSPIAKFAIVEAIKQAESKSTVVINLQGIRQWDCFAEAVHCITSKADIIIGNQTEQTAFAQAVNSLQLFPRTSQLVITTKGADGAEISQDGIVLCHVPAQAPKTFASSMGAGDAFIAGFLLAKSRNRNIEQSMRLAGLTATAILEEIGARPTQSLAHLFSGEHRVE